MLGRFGIGNLLLLRPQHFVDAAFADAPRVSIPSDFQLADPRVGGYHKRVPRRQITRAVKDRTVSPERLERRGIAWRQRFIAPVAQARRAVEPGVQILTAALLPPPVVSAVIDQHLPARTHRPSIRPVGRHKPAAPRPLSPVRKPIAGSSPRAPAFPIGVGFVLDRNRFSVPAALG